jgi:hypothetical protein
MLDQANVARRRYAIHLAFPYPVGAFSCILHTLLSFPSIAHPLKFRNPTRFLLAFLFVPIAQPAILSYFNDIE